MNKIIAPVLDLQSYKNLFYMGIAFVLSNIYLVFFVTGFALSLGLSITVIGIPLLVLFLYLVRAVGSWEALLANGILAAHIEDQGEEPIKQKNNILEKIKELITDKRLWKRMLYLMLKYPLDLAVFVIVILFFSSSLELIFAPFLIGQSWHHSSLINALHGVAGSSLILSFIGILMLLLSFHLSNALAWIYRMFTGYFLSR